MEVTSHGRGVNLKAKQDYSKPPNHISSNILYAIRDKKGAQLSSGDVSIWGDSISVYVL
jgi:hypothetical protein